MTARDPIPLETAERMLTYVRGADDRDTWVKMANILRDEYGDEARDAWFQWGQQSSAFNERDAKHVWKSAGGGSGARATVGTLVKLARDGGYKPAAGERRIPADELAAMRAAREARQAEADRQAEIARSNAAAEAADFWQHAEPAESHPYLSRKQIPGTGCRVLAEMPVSSIDEETGEIKTFTARNVLLVPVRHGPGPLVGLQVIRSDGQKMFLRGTPSSGAYTVLGKPSKTGPVVIAEGYATAASVHAATGYCTVVAFNAGNLKPVAEKIRAALPDAQLIIAADDDILTPGNPGVKAAISSASAVGASIAMPAFNVERIIPTDDPKKPRCLNDFNDLHAAQGLDAVQSCFTTLIEPDTLSEMLAASTDKPESVGAPAASSTPDQANNTGSNDAGSQSSPAGEAVDDTPGPAAPHGGSGVDVIRDPADAPTIFAASPMDTAALFQRDLPDDGKIVFWRGDFYSWNGHRYAVRDQVYLHQLLYHFMAGCVTHKTNPRTGDFEVVAFSPKRAHVEDVMHALRAVCFTDLDEPPTWIDQRAGDPPPAELIAFRNGFLHLPTRTLMRATPRLFVTAAVEFDYDPAAPAPVEWLKFLHSVWPEDPQSIEALGEVFGYMLTDDTSQQKMFMMIGPPRSGKGTILRILESVVGAHNRVSPSLGGISDTFGLQPLIGKRMAMFSDARLSGKTDQQPIVENLLRISGEDTVTVGRKNTTSWTGRLPTRIIMASNETPSFSDSSGALANRFIMFRFNTSFLGREDRGLSARLMQELPGVVLWALEGLQRLVDRGYMTTPDSGRELSDEMREQSSPIGAFVADKCVLHPDYRVDRFELYAAWKAWCVEQGMDHPGTSVSFGRKLSAAVAGIGRSQPRDGDGRANLYSGIRIRSYSGDERPI